MKISIFAYTNKGCETAIRASEILTGDVKIYAPEKFCTERKDFYPIGSSQYEKCFSECDALIFIGATGIAVRNIAPYIKDKTKDPAVISMDEQGKNIIPILSGHIGGANALALKIAKEIGGYAVITTATDINGKFSVDTWATKKGFIISDMEKAKEISAAILERDIEVVSEFPVTGNLPDGLTRVTEVNQVTVDLADDKSDVPAIYIGVTKIQGNFLRLIPRVLHVGIGCRKDIEKEKIEELFNRTIEENHIDERAIKIISSIDIKKDEEGLILFAKEKNLPINFYSAEKLSAVEGDFSTSEFVENVTGVDNVCERAALLSAIKESSSETIKKRNPETIKESSDEETVIPKIIVRKTSLHGVTIAIAKEYPEVNFE